MHSRVRSQACAGGSRYSHHWQGCLEEFSATPGGSATERTVVTVTSPDVDEEPTREEASSSGLRGQEAGHAEGREEETLTEDPDTTGDVEGIEILVSEEDEANSPPLPANQDADVSILSPSALSAASNATRTKERVETSPTEEKGGVKRPATTLHTTQASEMVSLQEKSPDVVMNNEGDCPSSCPSNVTGFFLARVGALCVPRGTSHLD